VKVILSRKGSDSGKSSGQMASPILPCGCLCSIPIPYEKGIPYSKIQFGQRPFQEICSGLKSDWRGLAHLDPDLRAESTTRPRGWRAAFGQSSAAAGHLEKQGVGEGDLFLFFGWFRKTERSKGGLKFVSGDPGRHIIYGWLQVGRVFPVNEQKQLPNDLLFLQEHPHFRFLENEKGRNTIYVSSQRGLQAGLFGVASDELVLTQPESSIRSQWRLPTPAFKSLFHARSLSYHGNAIWGTTDQGIDLRAVSRGQEFVFDGTQHSAAYEYCVNLIEKARRRTPTCGHRY